MAPSEHFHSLEILPGCPEVFLYHDNPYLDLESFLWTDNIKRYVFSLQIYVFIRRTQSQNIHDLSFTSNDCRGFRFSFFFVLYSQNLLLLSTFGYNFFSFRNPLHIPWCASGLNKVVFGDGLKHDVLTRQMGQTHSNNIL